MVLRSFHRYLASSGRRTIEFRQLEALLDDGRKNALGIAKEFAGAMSEIRKRTGRCTDAQLLLERKTQKALMERRVYVDLGGLSVGVLIDAPPTKINGRNVCIHATPDCDTAGTYEYPTAETEGFIGINLAKAIEFIGLIMAENRSVIGSGEDNATGSRMVINKFEEAEAWVKRAITVFPPERILNTIIKFVQKSFAIDSIMRREGEDPARTYLAVVKSMLASIAMHETWHTIEHDLREHSHVFEGKTAEERRAYLFQIAYGDPEVGFGYLGPTDSALHNRAIRSLHRRTTAILGGKGSPDTLVRYALINPAELAEIARQMLDDEIRDLTGTHHENLIDVRATIGIASHEFITATAMPILEQLRCMPLAA